VRGDDARDAEPAAQLQRARAAQRPARDVVRERARTRPQLRPVGEELLLGERLLVEQRVAVARAQDREVQAVDRDGLLDQVLCCAPYVQAT
jgi:hypothetical protein